MRPKFLAVMPYVYPEYALDTVASCHFGSSKVNGRFLRIDNTTRNRGIMRSHNLGLDMLRGDDEWFIIMSAALVFGPQGGVDFLDHLIEHDDHGVISCSSTLGWHLVAFRRDVVEGMGRWDENFTPYGYDDLDLSIRIHRLMPDVLWGGYPCDVVDRGKAHSINKAGVRADWHLILDYWRRKWGAEPGSEFHEYHTKPFANMSHHMNYWPEINGARWNERLHEEVA